MQPPTSPQTPPDPLAQALEVSAAIKSLALGDAPGRTFFLAAAESLTVGRVQSIIGLTPGASGYFLGGITAYTLGQKTKLLGVPLLESQPCDGVSESVARRMAFGARRLFGADVAVATTGFAEPAPGAGTINPMAWWAVAWSFAGKKEQARTGRVEWPGCSRLEAQTATALAAATALRDVLEHLRAQ